MASLQKEMSVTHLEPASIQNRSTTTPTGKGQLDDHGAGASFIATLSAKGVRMTSCNSDAIQDKDYKSPVGAGSITLKAFRLPISAVKTETPVEIRVNR